MALENQEKVNRGEEEQIPLGDRIKNAFGRLARAVSPSANGTEDEKLEESLTLKKTYKSGFCHWIGGRLISLIFLFIAGELTG